jgi:DNA-binding CsgD family transcriptional regulator
MTPPEWHAQAKRLRAEGLTYREIGEHLMRPRSTVEAAVSESNARRRAYKRTWDREHPETCRRCGGLKGPGHRERLCRPCWLTQEQERMQPRAERIVAWWAEGRTLAEIGAHLGWSKGHVTNHLHRLRAKGYDLPYRRVPRKA